MSPGGCPVFFLAGVDPSYLVAALVLFGFVIVFAMQSRHYKRIKSLTEEVRKMGGLKEGLESIQRALEEMSLEQVVTAQEEFREALSKLEQKMETPVPSPMPDQQETPEGNLYEEVEKYMAARGYMKVRLPPEPAPEREAREGEYSLPLEAYRDGTAYKGHVVIQHGRIVSERMKPAYEAFP
jgi:hypothetical protein